MSHIGILLIIILLTSTNTNQDDFDECNKLPARKSYIKNIDLVIIIDDSIYQNNETKKINGQYYSMAYYNFLQSFVESANFSYSPNGTRRTIFTTYPYQVRQDFSHGKFISDRNDPLIMPPYSMNKEAKENELKHILKKLKTLFKNKERNAEKFVISIIFVSYLFDIHFFLIFETFLLVLTRGLLNSQDSHHIQNHFKTHTFFIIYMSTLKQRIKLDNVFPPVLGEKPKAKIYFKSIHVTPDTNLMKEGYIVAQCLCRLVAGCRNNFNELMSRKTLQISTQSKVLKSFNLVKMLSNTRKRANEFLEEKIDVISIQKPELFNTTTDLINTNDFDKNPKEPDDDKKSDSNIVIIIGVSIAILIFIVIMLIPIIVIMLRRKTKNCCRKRRKGSKKQQQLKNKHHKPFCTIETFVNLSLENNKPSHAVLKQRNRYFNVTGIQGKKEIIGYCGISTTQRNKNQAKITDFQTKEQSHTYLTISE